MRGAGFEHRLVGRDIAAAAARIFIADACCSRVRQKSGAYVGRVNRPRLHADTILDSGVCGRRSGQRLTPFLAGYRSGRCQVVGRQLYRDRKDRAEPQKQRGRENLALCFGDDRGLCCQAASRNRRAWTGVPCALVSIMSGRCVDAGIVGVLTAPVKPGVVS